MSRRSRAKESPVNLTPIAGEVLVSSSATPEASLKVHPWVTDPDPDDPLELFANFAIHNLESFRLQYFYRWLGGVVEQESTIDQVSDLLLKSCPSYRVSVIRLKQFAKASLRLRLAHTNGAPTPILDGLESAANVAQTELRMNEADLIASHLPEDAQHLTGEGCLSVNVQLQTEQPEQPEPTLIET